MLDVKEIRDITARIVSAAIQSGKKSTDAPEVARYFSEVYAEIYSLVAEQEKPKPRPAGRHPIRQITEDPNDID